MSKKKISQSPTAFLKDKGSMDFPAAMHAIIAGGRITKLEWDNSETYGMLRSKQLMIRLNKEWHQWIINDGDLLGKDWIVL